MTDGGIDSVGQLLRDQAARVAAQVTPPDWRSVIGRQAPRRNHPHVRIMIVAAAALLIAVAIAVAVTVQPGTGRHHPEVAAYRLRFGQRVFVVRDLLAAQRAAPVLGSSHIHARRVSIATPDHASIAFGAGSVWALSYPADGRGASCGKLIRVDAATTAVTGTVPIPLCPDGVAYGQGSVWVLSFQINVRGYQLVRVNPSTLAIESITRIDAGPGGVTPAGDTGAKSLFVTATRRLVFTAVQDRLGVSQIVTVDPAAGQATQALRLRPAEGSVTALAANHSAVWVGTDNGWVLALDPVTGAVKSARHIGTRVISLSPSDKAVWVTVNLPAPKRSPVPGLDVLRLNPATGAVTKDTGLPMIFVATDGPAVWALSSEPPYASDSGLVAQVNPATGSIMKRAELPSPGAQVPDTIGVYRGSAWIINDFLETLTKVNP
jgi:hypothetical protein